MAQPGLVTQIHVEDHVEGWADGLVSGSHKKKGSWAGGRGGTDCVATLFGKPLCVCAVQ